MKTLIFLLCASIALAKVNYNGYEVWRLAIQSEKDVQQLRTVATDFNLDIWSEGNGSIDVMFPSDLIQKLDPLFSHQGIRYDVIIHNVQSLIDAEDARIAADTRIFGIDKYNTWDEIETYLSEVANNAQFTQVSIGQSYEGRNLWQMKYRLDESVVKPVIWIDCGTHSREWVSQATCLYGIDKLNQSDPMFDEVLQSYDLNIIPVNNPDGYVYSWTDDRLWRKNRNPNEGYLCMGVDLNRNYDIDWCVSGSSNNSCTDTFCGSSPASEPETQANQNALIDQAPAMLFSIHAYSQLWMYPFSYSLTPPLEEPELALVSEAAVTALTNVYGTSFIYGPISTTIYQTSGSSVDYAYFQGITHSYALELRDEGENGFVLPEDQILPTAEETWAGLIAAILNKP